MTAVRPTLRCLREDLRVPVPPQTVPLDEVEHPLLRKANGQFADDSTRHERIVEIDDQVLFKVKVQRWRGAVWSEPTLSWLIAAGTRESGSPDDFYAALGAAARAARARYNAEHRPALVTTTYVKPLLPDADDRERLRAESGVRLDRRLQGAVATLVRASLRDGHEHAAAFDNFTVSIHVRADDGHETYVAVRVTGSVPLDLIGVILDLVPGCDPDGWFPEFTGLPHRRLVSGEVAWSNIMDPSAAAKVLEAEDS